MSVSEAEHLGCVAERDRLKSSRELDYELVKRFDVYGSGGDLSGCLREMLKVIDELSEPIPMLLWCPCCNARHVDAGDFATKSHHTHACQGCGHVWRPAKVKTVGVQFLPGFRNDVFEKKP